VNPWLRIVRAGNLLVSFVGVLVGGLAAVGLGVGVPASFWVAVLLAALSTACITAAGNVLNDLLDVETDRTNHPDRPLVQGTISLPQARALTVGLFIAGVAVVVPIVPTFPAVGVILAIAVGALLGYEFRFKARGFVGNLVVALLTGLVFLYGGAAAGALLVMVPFAAMAFFATLSREVIKDMEDVAGDVDRRTLPQTHGLPFSAGVARSAAGVAIAAGAVPFLWFLALGSVAGIIYLGLVLVADAIFVVSVAYLPTRLHWEQTMSKVAMTVALFAFLAVAFR
jgi:geranylgeranylglycerol-phosphate geranylgeranyltransferase